MQPDKSACCPGAALDVETAVTERYSAASRRAEPALCCSASYDPKYLRVLPPELIERDYGCGDPSRHLAEGEVVLDLGSGGGKICYIASQIVGPRGRVIGVDMNDDMLALARRHQADIASSIGWNNVEFRKGRIQDLALDVERFNAYLGEHSPHDFPGWLAAENHADELRRTQPLVASQSIDVIVSNCVLNLVRPRDRESLFLEMFRVLRPGGRAVISDIVSDREVPARLQADAALWSGCVSGADPEPRFIAKFAAAGFGELEILARAAEPWTTVEGIEFRSITVRARKPVGSQGEPGKQALRLEVTEACGPGCCSGRET